MKRSIPVTSLIVMPEVQEFMVLHEKEEVKELVLKFASKVTFDLGPIAQQMELRQKAKKKINEFITPYTVLLPKLYEQSTNEEVAKYKATFIQGKTLLDATAGLGIDCFYIGRNFEQITCLESNTQHANLLKHNFKQHDFIADVQNRSLEEFLVRNKQSYDVIYIDPDRRPDADRKYFEIDQCTPNIINLKSFFIQWAKETWIKLSPMMDIHSIIQNFKPNISEVNCIAHQNEMKEILICLKPGDQTIKYTATNIARESTYTFTSYNMDVKSDISNPLKYFFEPNVALIKSKLCMEYCEAQNLKVLYPNGYYFTTEEAKEGLQGRLFEIIEVIPYKKKILKDFAKQHNIEKANISCRNFFWRPEEVKKHLNLSDGGELYLFCYNGSDKKPVSVWCKKAIV